VRRQNLPMMENRGPYRRKSGNVMFGFFARYRLWGINPKRGISKAGRGMR